MEDLNDLALFAAVVSQGSFSAAGRSLGMPKSRVSRRIAALEERLGVRLLQRSTRAMHVTDIGASFLHHCESMLQAARDAMEVAAQATDRPSGRLRVSCPFGVAHLFLTRLIPAFIDRYPDVRLELELTTRRVDVIAEGFDIALRIRTTIENSDLIVRHLGLSQQVLVASPTFVSAHGPFDTAASLRGQRGIGPGPRDQSMWCVTSPDGDSVEIGYVPVFLTDDIHLAWQATRAGAGIARLPIELCAASFDDGTLCELLPNHRSSPHQLHAVYPSRRELAPAVRAFVDALSESFTQTIG